MDLQTQINFILRTLQSHKIQIDDTARATAANIKSIAHLNEFIAEIQEQDTVLNEWRDDVRSQFEYLVRAQEQTDKNLKTLAEAHAQIKTLLVEMKRKLDNESQN